MKKPVAFCPHRIARIAVLLFGFTNALAQSAPAVFNILDFGAKSDGKSLNTSSIQAAIDKAHECGGGLVLVPKGDFLCGSIHLKSHVELHLEQDATLLGSTSRFDYEKINWYAMILADGQENISISGTGSIDGQGAALASDVVRLVKEGKIVDPYWGNNRPHERERPQLIEFARCKNVRVSGVLMKNSACWVQNYDRCNGLKINNIRVESRAYWNNDGIDVVDCRNVHIHHCDINSADDGICLKSSNLQAICDSILIENCTIRSSASALKFGTASKSGFRNVRVRKLKIFDTYRSAVALEIVDGGTMEHIEISDIEAKNTGNAIFIRLGQRRGEPGTLRDIYIHDLKVEVPDARPDAGYAFEGPEVREPHNLFPSSITGLPGNPVRNVRLENILIRFGGGGQKERAFVSLDSLDKIPERRQDYPEFSMFGELPAWGFYVRHVEGLSMKNIRLVCAEPDFRSALVFDNVRDLLLHKIKINKGSPPFVVLRAVGETGIKKVCVKGKKAPIRRMY